MGDSQPNSRVFSIRIVSLDYYMTPPIPNFDIAYSSLHGGKVKEVPVIRIYGSTPAGQKACLHIHRVLPYLYVPCSDLGLITDDQVDSQAHAISLALEKALKLKGNTGSKRQHVHGCSVVRARKFYGYHSSEELFVKIYFYYPQDVSRAAKLLLAGAVYDKVFQPYESHIPYLLQFLIDYNLYGMGHLHVSRMKFRYPVPDVFSPQRAKHNGKPRSMTDDSTCAATDFQADLDSSTIWISSTIPDGWIWQSSYQQVSSEIENIRRFRRQSISELEGDAVVDEIINQQFLSFAPLSQTHSDVKMVQSLIPIWEEELERTGVIGAVPPDSGKPAPQDVLRILSDGIEFEKLMELKNDGESFSTPQSIESSTNCGLVENGLVNFESSNNLPSKILNISDRSGSLLSPDLSLKYVDEAVNNRIDEGDKSQVSGTQVPSSGKASDDDAIQLLKWLASSQAAEDINSDDELARETILSPLLPAKNINKMLEKANIDYESESQQECQDILDSIDFLTIEVLNGRASNSEELNHSTKALSNKVIPQLDGSSDDLQSTPDADKSIYMDTGEAKLCQEVSSWSQIDSSLRSKYRMKRPRMGSLPISSQKTTIASHAKSSSILDTYDNEVKEGIGTSSYGCEGERFHSIAKVDEMKDVSSTERASSLVECSTRDLMRRKRSHRIQHSEYGSSGEDSRAEICFEAISVEGDASSEAKSRNDIQDKSSSLLPIHKPPVTENGINLCERDITSIVGVCNEASIVKSLSSCFASVENLAPSSSKDDVAVKSMLNNDDKETPVRLNPGARDSLQKNAVKPYTVPSNSAVGDRISKMDCKIESWGHRSSYTCKVVDFSAADLKSRENKAATLLFESSTSESVNKETEPVKLIVMNFSKKPPTIEWTDERGGEAPALSFDGDSGGGIVFQDRTIGGCLPFFTKNFPEEKDYQAVSPSNYEYIDNQEPVMGIPILYQNDGTHLFMLTPAVSPPSRESVDRWLSFDDSGILKKKIDLSSAFLPLSYEHSDDIVDSQGSQGDISESPLAELASCSYDMPNLDHSNRYNQESCSKEAKTLHVTDEKPSTGSLQDISQISGPDRKTKTTPLSQIGFRDPASVGAGQQLTLLSIEIQTESRGDLRPDPRFDAINVIALVFQEDSESTIDAHVLMRCDSAVVRKDIDAVSECEVLVFTEELGLFNYFTKVIQSSDPDVLMGWDVQSGSLGFLAERAAHLGLGLLNNISRTPSETNVASRDPIDSENGVEKERLSESLGAETVDTIIDDEWGRTHASGVHAGGRIVLNIWRLMRNEVKLNMYTAEAVAEAVLRRKIPSIPWNILSKWFATGPGKARFRSIEYILERAKLNVQIMNQLDMINRTSELARVFGIDFFSVLSRGSQYRVESMFLRLAHTQNYLAISPGNQQVASQPAMECLPLVMEPESRFYADPVIVLDFQSLYPSMVIAYNLCFCTCLGKITPAKADTLGVSSYSPDRNIFCNLKHELLVTPNGVVYVPSNVRKGILPRLLEEILSTRIMVKQAMKKLAPSQKVLHRILNARQLALKLIANVTYGYTAAGFSGRMPCAELADSIVQCGRRTLETAISFVNSNEKWKARVIYGDTDSMFVLLKGRSLKEAFAVGREIASAISEMNPDPVTLKMEKVYYPSFLLTKKRYVGYSYENSDQIKPMFDAKGIETVRRDTCEAVSKTLEQSLRIYFECQDIDKVKAYLQRQWTRILSGRVSLKDFIFAKEVRLGTYSSRSSSLPPAAIVATKAMRADPRAEPRYAERVPYVVVHGEPGARLVDMVVDPLYLLALDSPFRLNDIYYISKQIIPALQRVFGLVGADLNRWFLEMPRPGRVAVGKRHSVVPNPLKTRIDYYYLSKHCILCGELVQASVNLCQNCSRNESLVAMALTGRISKSEKDIHHLAAICRHCGGGDWRIESGVKCINLACSIFYERRKVQKELQSLSEVGAITGLYPKCMVEWF